MVGCLVVRGSMQTIFKAGLLLLALALAGCDSCGDFNNPLRGQTQSCRQQSPAQQSR
jgi:hypothetical protein